jgi:peptide/nickel transport system permease protein
MPLAFFVRRLLQAAVLLAGVATLTFLLTRALPGGPETLLARNSRITEAQRAAILHNLGLDQPVPVQLLRWGSQVLRGDMGISFTQQRPVSAVITERMGPTFRLMAVSMVLSLVVALFGGVVSVLWPGTFASCLIAILNAFALTAPLFWVGLMLQLAFAVHLRWLPSADMTRGLGLLDDLRYLPLPAVTLALGFIAGWSRYLSAALAETLRADYLRTARAKGLTQAIALLRHGMANARTPFLTIILLDAPLFVVGAVVTETVFSWPGVGRLFFDSLRVRDYPVVLGITLYASALVVGLGIVTDVLAAAFDPRIRRPAHD